jgi:hypothetical protein
MINGPGRAIYGQFGLRKGGHVGRRRPISKGCNCPLREGSVRHTRLVPPRYPTLGTFAADTEVNDSLFA